MSNPLATLPPLVHARVVGAYAKTALDTARELGADLPELHGAPPESLPVRRYVTLLDDAAAQLGDPLFGLKVGQRMRLATFAGYGLVLCTCANFRAAAEQTRRFEGLAHDLGRSEMLERDGIAHYRWHSPWLALPGGRHLADSVMAGIRVFANWLAGQPLPMIDVAFTHVLPAGVSAAAYEDAFGGPVRFGAPVTEARFAAALLDAPVSNADPSLFPALERTAAERLAAREREAREPVLVGSVRAQIRALLMHDRARLADVAAALGLPARTLQRQLAGAGASFSGLLDQTRRELAQQYLLDTRLSLTDVAFLLGFGQQSNFNHAFRAWFATTPAAWREATRRRGTSA